MGWTPQPGNHDTATFSFSVQHVNGLYVRISLSSDESADVVPTTEGKAAFEAALNALLTDTDFTLLAAGLSYWLRDSETYTP